MMSGLVVRSAPPRISNLLTPWDDLLRRCRLRVMARVARGPDGSILASWFEHGKMLRPLVVLLAANAAGRSAERVLPAAEALELLHGASLIHDDVIDRSDTRRGSPALHVQIGVPRAIVAGDYALFAAFEAMGELRADHQSDRVLDAMTELARLAETCCHGQAAELPPVSTSARSEDDCVNVAAAKAGSVFAAAALLGGLLSDADTTAVTELREFGWHLGVAFQLRDDLLDLVGDQRRLGKPVGNSVANGRPLLALAMLHRAEHEAARKRILSCLAGPSDGALSDDQRSSVCRVLEEEGVFDDVQGVAEEHAATARAHLRTLRPSSAVEALSALTRFAVGRSK
jgi:geranylgeranyl pyrophosphate synthase